MPAILCPGDIRELYEVWCGVVGAGEKQYKFEEILPIYKHANDAAEAGTFADFMEAFKTFDREGQGFINAAEMRHVLTSLGILYLSL